MVESETTLEAVERDFGASTRGEEPGEDLLFSSTAANRPLQRSAICDYPRIHGYFGSYRGASRRMELDYLIADPALGGRVSDPDDRCGR